MKRCSSSLITRQSQNNNVHFFSHLQNGKDGFHSVMNIIQGKKQQCIFLMWVWISTTIFLDSKVALSVILTPKCAFTWGGKKAHHRGNIWKHTQFILNFLFRYIVRFLLDCFLVKKSVDLCIYWHSCYKTVCNWKSRLCLHVLIW